MRIKIQQFLFKELHSWRNVGLGIGRALLKAGHDVEFISSNGIDPIFLPKDLEPFVRENPTGKYDMQVSYTAMFNFDRYLQKEYGDNRFGIWNYEFDNLPVGMSKYALGIDKFLPSSKFFYDICLKGKIPSDKMDILPHGVDWDRFENAQPMVLKTNKKVKFLLNIAQPHIRKNITGALNAFGKAFTNKDDVCLVLKVVDKEPKAPFEESFSKIFKVFEAKYPNHAECLVIKDYVPSIESLYKACDALFMIPNAEAFFLPALETLAAGKIVITSNYGGQLDFLNDKNSFLIDGKMVRAPQAAQYWNANVQSSMFQPDENKAVETLRYVANNINSINLEKPSDEFKKKFSWDGVAEQLIGYCK